MMDVKKLLYMPQSLWDRISDYRFTNRYKTANEALRDLIEIGLSASRERRPEPTLEQKQEPPH